MTRYSFVSYCYDHPMFMYGDLIFDWTVNPSRLPIGFYPGFRVGGYS